MGHDSHGAELMFRRSLEALANNVSIGWKAIVAIAGLVTILVAAQRKMSALGAVPAQMEIHRQQTDSLIVEIREMRKISQKQLCVAVTPRANWDRDCLLP